MSEEVRCGHIAFAAYMDDEGFARCSGCDKRFGIDDLKTHPGREEVYSEITEDLIRLQDERIENLEKGLALLGTLCEQYAQGEAWLRRTQEELRSRMENLDKKIDQL